MRVDLTKWVNSACRVATGELDEESGLVCPRLRSNSYLTRASLHCPSIASVQKARNNTGIGEFDASPRRGGLSQAVVIRFWPESRVLTVARFS